MRPRGRRLPRQSGPAGVITRPPTGTEQHEARDGGKNLHHTPALFPRGSPGAAAVRPMSSSRPPHPSCMYRLRGRCMKGNLTPGATSSIEESGEQVRADPPVLLLEDVVVDPAAARSCNRGWFGGVGRQRSEGPGRSAVDGRLEGVEVFDDQARATTSTAPVTTGRCSASDRAYSGPPPATHAGHGDLGCRGIETDQHGPPRVLPGGRPAPSPRPECRAPGRRRRGAAPRGAGSVPRTRRRRPP